MEGVKFVDRKYHNEMKPSIYWVYCKIDKAYRVGDARYQIQCAYQSLNTDKSYSYVFDEIVKRLQMNICLTVF